MESKITFRIGDDYKPVIKVIEKASEDARDDIASGFRRLFGYDSSTLTVEFQPDQQVQASYVIKPVEDELEYFQNICLNKINFDGKAHSSQKTFIKSFFAWMKSPTISPYIEEYSNLNIKSSD